VTLFFVENSLPVGYVDVDQRHKANPALNGQFVYAALVRLQNGAEYIATLKFDDYQQRKKCLCRNS